MREIDINKSLDQGGDDPPNGVYVSLVSIDPPAGYVYSDTNQFYSDITNVVGTPAIIGNPIVSSRIFSGDAVVFTNVTGSKIGAIVSTRQNAGAASTWRVVLYEDTGIIGLPMIPSGGNLIITWNVQGIFGL